jgi:polyphosphate kinase
MAATEATKLKEKRGAKPVLVPRPRLLNRELSWLDFAARVLELAVDKKLPLLERVKFCAIFSAALDEYFAVRVAGLLEQVAAGVTIPFADGRTPAETLAAVRAYVGRLEERQAALWEDELRPALAKKRICVVDVAHLNERELKTLEKRFDREISPLLTPMAVGPTSPFPHIPSLALSVGVFARDGKERRFARVNVPDAIPRFLPLGKRGSLVRVEEAIATFLPALFPGVEIEEHSVFRVTRDADLDVSDDADDLLEAVREELRERRFGDVVRLEVETSMSPEMRRVLGASLRVAEPQVYERRPPLGLNSLLELTRLDRPDLKDEPWPASTQRRLQKREPDELLTQVRRRDLLAHHPYDSFGTSVAAFVQAARDPSIVALKATVYRTNESSPVVPELIHCAEEGKQAVCIVELKARFDESRNIEWSRALEHAGVHVVHGVPGLKCHAKLTLLVRREKGGVRRYVHVGTGNYHSGNACSYEDLSLFTADEEIAADVADLFNAVTGFARPRVYRKLLVGPVFLREGISAEIRRVTAAARAGERARIRIKVNALVDPELAEELYAAADAGAKVDIVARGICVLVPRPGITVRSVLGRYLEHSRIYAFEAGERASHWIGSADLMPRNLDRRIEVLVPVEDLRLRGELDAILDALMADDVHSWELNEDGAWDRVEARGKKSVSAQEALMRRAERRAEKKRR